MSGRGNFKYYDGKEYSGEFKLNKLNGVGEMKLNKGQTVKGTWING